MYAAELDETNTVIRVIVGTAEWATANLGGTWVDSPKCGPGWTFTDGEFEPPYVEPVDPDDNEVLG